MMRINQLPVKTFNHLKMNETRIDYQTKEGRKIEISQSGIYDFKDPEDLEVEIRVAEETELTVVMNFFAKDTLHILTRIEAEDGAKLKLIQIGDAPAANRLINQVEGQTGRQASISLIQLFPGKGDAYSDNRIDLVGDKSQLQVDVAFLTKTGQHTDMNYVANHYGRETTSDIETSGAVMEGGTKVMRQTIDFKTGAAGSVGEENEHVLLLGDQLINQSIPLILCAEEDVQGAHGAQIGSLDEEMLFYLGSRGIDELQAKKMMMLANFNRLLQEIDEEDFRETTYQRIKESIYDDGQ